MNVAEHSVGSNNGLFSWLQCHAVAIHICYSLTICINEFGMQIKGAWSLTIVLNLSFNIELHLMSRDVEVRAIDISSSSSKVAVQRQGLIYSTRHMQPHILWYTTIVGIEVLIVPLVAAIGSTLTVSPTIVYTNSQDVLTFYNIRCKIVAACHNTILR